MKRAMVLGLAAVLAGNAQGAADVAVPLAPSGKWVVGHEDGLCTLFRDFGAPIQDTVTFGIKPMSLSDIVTLVAMVPKNRAVRRPHADKTQLTVFPAGTTIPIKFESKGTSRDGGIAVILTIDRGDLSELMAATRIGIEADDFTVTIAPTAGPKALAALTTCEAGVMTAWGVDPAALAAVATPARAMSPDGWITDYPASALQRQSQGTSTIFWQITVEGRASGCRTVNSSGDADLDAAACAAVTKRARYTPALDKDGHPVRSWSSRRVSFSMPGS